MGRKFTCRKAKLIRAPRVTVYLKNPVGSNEWHREKRIEATKRQVAEEQARQLQETRGKNMVENRQANWSRPPRNRR